MRAAHSQRGWRGRRGRLTPTARSTGWVLALALVTVAGCGEAPAPSRVGATRPTVSGSSGTTSTPMPGAAAATAKLDTETTSTAPSTCADTIGAVLRERTTVTTASLVTVLAGALPCAGIGLWAATFTLDGDPTIDPVPQFGARYTGAQTLAVRLPAASGRCAAAAVFFSVDADTAAERAAVTGTAGKVRGDLGSWPAGSTGLVPGGAILQGRTSPVLAASVVGDPSGCSPGESVSTPTAGVGDCWTALPAPAVPATAGPPPSAASSTRFRRTTCNEPHTHEVYWAEGLTTDDYVSEGQPAHLGAAAWARMRAEKVCADKSRSVKVATGVDRSGVFLELLWPATLSYPPSSPGGWMKSQLVCLARWKDGKASPRQILAR